MKRFTFLMIMVFCAGTLFAQSDKSNAERQKRWEEMKAKRAAYFTEHIGFTEEEAQNFWPVYNQLQEEKDRLHKKLRQYHHNAKKDDKGEKVFNYEIITDEMIKIKVQEANLDKTYYQKFKQILPPEKLFRFYQTERNWGGELLKQIEKRGDKK